MRIVVDKVAGHLGHAVSSISLAWWSNHLGIAKLAGQLGFLVYLPVVVLSRLRARFSI